MEQLLEKLGINWSLLIAQIVNFMIVLGVLSYFIYRPFLDLLDKRRERIQKSMDDAARIEHQMQEFEAMRLEEMKKLDRESGAYLEQMRRKAGELQEEMIATAAKEAESIVANAHKRAEEERRRQLTKLLAEIEKRIHDENARPKKRYLSPATLRSVDALYYSAFRTQIERAGTTYFPTDKGQKLYGELVMEVWINRGGQVVDAIVLQSSGNALLDKRARAIVMQAGPFGAVPAEVSAGNDLLLLSSRFRFTRDAGMEASTEKTVSTEAP